MAAVAAAALLFFWGVGAYNRLMSLRNVIGEA
ncbi:MAG: LemA family protein, partial [Burkholderiales bacterium]|nr:LemA family protein [Burkholderiales bacterium]